MKALKFEDLKKMSKADLSQLLVLLLEVVKTLETGARFDYKIGDIVIAGKSLDYGVYVMGSAAPVPPAGAFSEAKPSEKPIKADKSLWK